MKELTDEEIEKYIEQIENMSQREMASLWRFAPIGNPFFDKRYPLYDAFKKRFDKLGGFTPEISKEIGWTK